MSRLLYLKKGEEPPAPFELLEYAEPDGGRLHGPSTLAKLRLATLEMKVSGTDAYVPVAFHTGTELSIRRFTANSQDAPLAVRGEGVAGTTGAAEPLTAEQRVQQLLALYKDQYDYARGRRLQAELQRRMQSAPIIPQQSDLQIADYFRPLGYHKLVAQLEAVLVAMEEAHEAYIDVGGLDSYQRGGHIIQLAAAPGLGKSTASRLLWVALHQVLKKRSLEPPSPAAVLQQRIFNSITPNNLLLFQLDLGADGLSKLAPEEEDALRSGSSSAWTCILAWRLLYSVLHVSCRLPNAFYLPYDRFLQKLKNQTSHLLFSLEPLDIVSFVRSCAPVADRPVLMAWALDEAQSFDHLPQLLSAFVQFRINCTQPCTGCNQCTPGQPAATLPVCLVMSTLWSSTNLAATASRKARVYDIQLWPLNRVQMCAVLVHMQQRLQLHAASQHGGASSSMQVSLDEWEPLDLTPSSELHHFTMGHEDAALLLDIVAGNPRLLAFLLSAVLAVHGGDPAEALKCWLNADRTKMTTLKATAVTQLRDALFTARFGWDQGGRYAEPEAHESKQLLVKAMVTHAVTGIMVERTALVAATTSGTLGTVSWEYCEQRGYVTLIPAAAQASRMSEEGMEQPKRAHMLPASGQLVYVVMPPIMLSVLGVKLFPQLRQVSALVASVSHKGREHLDCAMIALRAWLARNNIPDMMEMSVEQLVCGRQQPSTAQLEMEGVEGPAMPVLQQYVVLPTKPPVLHHMDAKLDDQQFEAHISQFEGDDDMPYAWVGPGNHKADSWVLMRMACTSPAVPSSPPSHSKPLIIYISSKQRAGKQVDYVSAHSILLEAKKDVWGDTAPYVYVYVTDQRPASDVCEIRDKRIVVVGPLQHEAFYGSACALVELMRER